eukprot:TRINITY_DN5622_c0_g1_i1.p1 TRINITY_DN5622_c0_g1~~TRINITY_DN5622_c0_g1_i1.p1  ORF type:complete len:686 (-),score=73.51 TRINITY_DN5622_c0_g1_i1:5164-7221(-)
MQPNLPETDSQPPQPPLPPFTSANSINSRTRRRPSSAPPRPRFTTPSIDALTLPDTFDDFIRLGDGAPPPVSRSPSQPPPPVDTRSTPTQFLTSLVRVATDTLETGLSHAARGGTGMLTAAGDVLPALSAVFAERTTRDPTPRYARRPAQLQQLRAAPSPLLLIPSRATVVCETALARLAPVRPGIVRIELENQHGTAISPHVSPSTSPPNRGRNLPRVTAAAFVPREARFVMGASTNHVYSFSVDLNDRRVSRMLRAAPTSIAVSPDERFLYVGTSDGYLHVMDSNLSVRVTCLPPEIVSASLGSAFRHAPVSHVTALSESALICYDEGVVCHVTLDGDLLHPPFVAHARRTSGALGFFGVLALTIGDATDPSVCLFELSTGRCLLRRVLSYAPTCVKRVNRSLNVVPRNGEVCPSEVTFLVGGEEGNVEVYRLIILSPQKVELNLVYTVGERIRKKDKNVVDLHYLPEEAVILALLSCGEVKRWHLTRSQASSLSLIEEDSSVQPTFTEESVVEATEQDFSLPDYGRHTSTNVLKAQTVLATILDEDVVPEQVKDTLVTEFTKEQSAMVSRLVNSDTELRRARRRILARFINGIRSDNELGSVTERTLARASKRMAAMEMEHVTREHSETFREIQSETVVKLKTMLKGVFSMPFLLRTNSEALSQAKRDIESIDPEDTQTGWN